MTIVVGADLSLSGLGLVAIPPGWFPDWSKIRRVTLHSPNSSRPAPERYHALAEDVVRWVAWVREAFKDEVSVWAEGSIMMRDRAHSIRSQLKLHGVVENYLWRHLKLELRTAEQTSGRMLFLGRMPTKDRKSFVAQCLQKTGCDFDDLDGGMDKGDAFVAGNYGVHELGLPHFLAGLLGEKPARPKKPRVVRRAQAQKTEELPFR